MVGGSKNFKMKNFNMIYACNTPFIRMVHTLFGANPELLRDDLNISLTKPN